MSFSIIPISVEYATGFRDVFDSIAKERKFLMFVAAPPLEVVEAYVTKNIERGYPHFIALRDSEVVGWCDAPASDKEGFRHTGYLGIGVHQKHRGNGIGKALLSRTIETAFKGALSRIELDVFSSNAHAINMYQRFGFIVEGRKRQGRIIDGTIEDVLIMSLLK
jgi:RimJ/RimL family protein N-acetyltransferase